MVAVRSVRAWPRGGPGASRSRVAAALVRDAWRIKYRSRCGLFSWVAIGGIELQRVLRIALLFAAYISLSTSFQLVQAGPSAVVLRFLP
jgi:hypothetical protein